MADSPQRHAGLAAPYANALFAIARDRGAVDACERELAALAALVAESPDLARLVASPVLDRAAQARALAAVLERAGADPLVRALVGVAARNRRLYALPAIARAFARLAAAHRGEVEAAVESARPLPEDLGNRLRETIAAALGRKVALRATVNPGLLGGLLVRVGSTLVDGSLRTRLRTIGNAMKGTA